MLKCTHIGKYFFFFFFNIYIEFKRAHIRWVGQFVAHERRVDDLVLLLLMFKMYFILNIAGADDDGLIVVCLNALWSLS